MSTRGSKRLVILLTGALAALLSVGAAGCAKRGGTADPATAAQGEMPEGGDFSGVYYDSYFGNLHLVRQGDGVTGKWRTDNGDAWGELEGDIKGNMLRFKWTEHKIGMVGASATTKGRGYFAYKRPDKAGDPDYIEGQRGLGEKDSGQKWKGVKQHNVPPNPDSVTPDEFEARGQGGGWDEDESSKSAGTGESPTRKRSKKAPKEEESSGGGQEEKKAPPPPPKSGDNNDTEY